MKKNYQKLKEKHPNIYKKVNNHKVDENTYQFLESKKSGYTIKVNKNEKYYIHSKYDPERESDKFIKEVYDSEVDEYIFIGFGLGYHIRTMLKNYENTKIYVVETDKNLFRLAMDNVDITDILASNRVQIYLEDEFPELGKIMRYLLKSNIKLIAHNIFIKNMGDKLIELKFLIEEYKVRQTSNHQMDLMEKNFDSNIGLYDSFANEFFAKYIGKTIYLVSAGPSLDKNVLDLKNKGDEEIIISVGRAVRTLVKAGIRPDMIVITDPSENLYDMQLKGLELSVSIIVLSTCDENVMKNYKGEKHIAFQKGYGPAEKKAKDLGIGTVETGGSVATTALDIAIRMGAARIVFVGQDLAYTYGETHSKETFSKRASELKDISKMRTVTGVNGDQLYTSKNLTIYRKWIEARIAREPSIEFIDATEGGAKIEGTKIRELKDIH